MVLASWLESFRTVVVGSDFRSRRSFRRQGLRRSWQAIEQLEERVVLTNSPTMNAIPAPLQVSNVAGTQTINLTGITDGDGGKLLSSQITVASIATTVVTNSTLVSNVSVNLPANATSGTLQYTVNIPGLSGTNVITLKLDDGVDQAVFFTVTVAVYNLDVQLASWVGGDAGQFAKIIDQNNVAAGPVTTWTGQTNPVLGDVEKISYSPTSLYIQAPELASYVMGPWFNDAAKTQPFSNLPKEQKAIFKFAQAPTSPTPPTSHTATKLGATGLLVNGVAIFDQQDGFSYNTAFGGFISQTGFGPSSGSGYWNRNAAVGEALTFDHANAHQPGTGEYHNHIDPIALRAQLHDNVVYSGPVAPDLFPYDTVDKQADSDTDYYDEATTDPLYVAHHSPIIGWAFDGLPIYGPYGYLDPMDASSTVVRLDTSYQLRNITARTTLPGFAAMAKFGDSVLLNVNGEYVLGSTQYGPAVSTQYPLGYFIEDYEYKPGLGALDQYNSRFAVTPEFPNGTQAYFITIDSAGNAAFPFFTGRQYFGNVSTQKVTSVPTSATLFYDANNTPPSFSNITDQCAYENLSIGPLPFTISDTQTPVSGLNVIVTSSDTSLIPLSGIVMNGSGTNRYITVTPATNKTGTATITLTAADSLGKIGTESFDVHVTSGVNLPTLDPLVPAPLVVVQDSGQHAIALTGISDGDCDTQPLRVTATTSDPNLIRDLSVAYTSNMPTGTAFFKTAAFASGTANIYVTVEDGGYDGNLSTTSDNKIVTQTMTISVGNVPDAPSMSLPYSLTTPLTIGEDAIQQSVPLTGISDRDNNTQQIMITATSSDLILIPTPTVVFNPTNLAPPNVPSTGTLKFTPTPQLSGTAIITVYVTDGGPDGDLSTPIGNQTSQFQFTVIVSAVNDQPRVAPPPQILNVNENTGSASPTVISLTGIDAGPNENQTMSVVVTSNNTGIIPTPTVSFTPPTLNVAASGSATINFLPLANKSTPVGQPVVLTVMIYDAGPDGNISTLSDNGLKEFNIYVNVQPVNDPPTLAPIALTTVPEDSGLKAIPLTGITAGPGESQILKVTAAVISSSVPGLIPNAFVEYTSPNSTGTLKFYPAPNLFGTATIRVTVEDAGLDGVLEAPKDADNLTFYRDVVINVTGSDDLPTLAQPANTTIDEDGATGNTVTLTGISDGDLNTQQLKIDVVSSNISLVPTPTVTFNQSPTSPLAALQTATLTFNGLASQQTGTSQIYVTLTDGGADGLLGTPGQLAAAVNNSATTIQVANTAIFPNPAVAPFNIKIGNELMRVTAVLSGNRFTVVRGVNNTPAAQHFLNDVVVHPQSLDNQSVTRTFTLTVANFNDPPTLDPLPAVNTSEPLLQATPPTTIQVPLSGITAGGNGTEANQPLRVTAVAVNPTAFTSLVVGYTSANTTGTLDITPAQDAAGTFTINVTVEDGGFDLDLNTSGDNNTFTRALTVNIAAGNDDPPVISSVANRVLQIGTVASQTVNLSGIAAGPFETGAVTVQITGNTTPGLFSVAPALSYTSPNTTGSLTFTPTGTVGSSDITLTVTDSLMQTTTMTFTVHVVNPPTLAPISGTSPITEGSGIQTLNLSGITSGDGVGQQVQVTAAVTSNPGLLENLVVNYSNPQSGGSVTYNPVANKTGTATITVTVTDAGPDNNLATTNDNSSVSQQFVVVVNQFNDLPTLTQPTSPLNMSEDQPNAGVINLTGITAGPLEFQHLRVIATSNNTSLVTAAVVYTNANSFGSINVTPVLNAVGSTTINIQVQDAGFDGIFGNGDDAVSSMRTVTVNVAASNDDPTLANIGSVTVAEDSGQSSITLTGIGAGFGESQTLSFSATSSIPGFLAASPTFVYTQGTNTATMNFTPAANVFGTSTITVTVTDDTSVDGSTKSVSKTFTLTVTPKNDAPTFDTVAQPSATVTIDENSAKDTVVMPIKFNDIDTPFNQLTFAIVGTGNIGGAFKVQYDNATGLANLVVANADALNFEQSSSFTVDVRIFDGSTVAPTQQFATRTFTVNLNDLTESLVIDPANWTNSGLIVKKVGSKVHVLNATTLQAAVPAHELSKITDIRVYGRQNAADVLTVDYSGGDPVPAGGLDFNGQNGVGDVIKLANANLLSTTDLTLTGPTAGTITDSGINTLALTDVEGIAFDTSATSGTINVLFSDASNSVSIADDVITNNGLSVMTSTSAPSVTFPVAAAIVIDLADGNDSLTISSIDTQSSTPISVNGGDGNDTLKAAVTLTKPVLFFGGLGNDVLAGGAAGDQLFGDEGNDSISGGSGDDNLDGGADDGVGSTDVNLLYETANVSFELTDTSLVGVGTDTLANLQLAKLTGGAGNNIFTISDWTGGGTLTGSTGTDRIVAIRDTDMTLSNSSLVSIGYGTLTLATIETAALTGGDSNNKIRANAFSLGAVTLNGGNGDDVLVGGTKDDSLFGGAGRDLLIGGAGKDTLSGDAGDDILIGGTSSVSNNVAALNAVMAEWTSGNDFATRVNNLTNGGGANGSTKLSATNDSVADRLTGGNELDWFFSSSGDVLVDFNSGIGELKKQI